MIKAGLTGNLGSGKTTVANVFRHLGVPVFFSDEQSKLILDLPDTISQVESFFGKDVIVNGKVDRVSLAGLVFEDAGRLKQLTGILHPAVQKTFLNWFLSHKNDNLVIKEAAILFESNAHQDLDVVICVVAPEDVRIKRVMERDHATAEMVRQRINNQWSEEKKAALSNYIIVNDGTTPVLPQVLKVYHDILSREQH